MMRGIILPKYWSEEASDFLARLNSFQPRYFLISYPASQDFKSKSYLSFLDKTMASNLASSAMIILPRSFAGGDKIDLWPSMVQSQKDGNWVASLFFADNWGEVEIALEGFSQEEGDQAVESHLTCQYQPPYTEMLKLWEQEGGKGYHPGDYFKEDILPAITQMKGNWVYWGHGEGDRLRGYSHLHTYDLIAHKCSIPLNLSLWFTCSTLDRNYPENIALAWYLSGATKCILASPEKVNTEANKLLSELWLEIAKDAKSRTISCIIQEILRKDSAVLNGILYQYYLLGIPWVSGNM